MPRLHPILSSVSQSRSYASIQSVSLALTSVLIPQPNPSLHLSVMLSFLHPIVPSISLSILIPSLLFLTLSDALSSSQYRPHSRYPSHTSSLQHSLRTSLTAALFFFLSPALNSPLNLFFTSSLNPIPVLSRCLSVFSHLFPCFLSSSSFLIGLLFHRVPLSFLFFHWSLSFCSFLTVNYFHNYIHHLLYPFLTHSAYCYLYPFPTLPFPSPSVYFHT